MSQKIILNEFMLYHEQKQCPYFMSFIEGGLGSCAGFVIYDENAADKRGEEVENLQNGPEDKENM